VLIITSVQDHVVDPSNSDVLAAAVTGPVERLRLERSYHVATLDYDKDLVASATVDFARKVTAG
jgi:carboxylesterase